MPSGGAGYGGEARTRVGGAPWRRGGRCTAQCMRGRLPVATRGKHVMVAAGGRAWVLLLGAAASLAPLDLCASTCDEIVSAGKVMR
ncbi:MAG: hypothetical protein ACPIOQ_16040 [Promethearchaeia archaeon]